MEFQAVSLPGSDVLMVFPLVPRSKLAETGGWGLGDGDIETEAEGLFEPLGEREADWESEALGIMMLKSYLRGIMRRWRCWRGIAKC
jgi:hypothetical protein